MATRRASLVVSLAFLLVAVVAAPAPAAGANPTFTLYGSETLGWGDSPTTMTSPGPHLTVGLDDNVTLFLNASDGQNHNWFIDYDGDGNDDPSEPHSPNFRNTQIMWNFTAIQEGTFAYRCKFHPTMWGNITIVAGGVTPPAGETWPYLVAGLVGALVVLVAVATWWVRNKKSQGPPPPT